MENFTISYQWYCPHCDAINIDKQDSSVGPIDELYCGECDTMIHLEQE